MPSQLYRSVRPQRSEHAEYHATYIGHVPDGDVLETLGAQIKVNLEALGRLSEKQGDYAYAAGKWTIRQTVGHMIDTERIFSYRALRFGRGDKTPVPGFEQDDYIAGGPFAHCSLESLIGEFAVVRQGTLLLFQRFDEEAWNRQGVASGFNLTVRALAWITAGHELHHMKVLKEKYGVA